MTRDGDGPAQRPLPRSTKLGSLSEAAFTAALQLYNNTPRKRLGYRTPAETLDDQVLHLECELIFPPSRERRFVFGDWILKRSEWRTGEGDHKGRPYGAVSEGAL